MRQHMEGLAFAIMAYPGTPPQAYPPQAYPPQQQQPQPPRKSSNKGCIIALSIVGVLVLLLVIGVAIAVYAISQNEDVRKIASAARDGVEIMREAQKAPGTSELRTLGCDEAMAIDMVRVAKLADRFVEAGTLPADMPGTMVVCSMQSASGAPTCAAVAKTYFGAVTKPTGNVAVSVQVGRKEQAECSELFAPDGSGLGAFDKSTAPSIPTSQP